MDPPLRRNPTALTLGLPHADGVARTAEPRNKRITCPESARSLYVPLISVKKPLADQFTLNTEVATGVSHSTIAIRPKLGRATRQIEWTAVQTGDTEGGLVKGSVAQTEGNMRPERCLIV